MAKRKAYRPTQQSVSPLSKAEGIRPIGLLDESGLPPIMSPSDEAIIDLVGGMGVGGIAKTGDVSRRALSKAFDKALDKFYSTKPGSLFANKPVARRRAADVKLAYEPLANPEVRAEMLSERDKAAAMRPKPSVGHEEVIPKAANIIKALNEFGYKPTQQEIDIAMEVARTKPSNFLLTFKGQFKNDAKIRSALSNDNFIKIYRSIEPAVPSGGNRRTVARRRRSSNTEPTPPDDLPPEFTAVGEEPPYKRPTFPDPVESVYKKVLEQGGRGKRPKDPRASGMVPGEDPNLRDPERVLPKFRSRAGMAIDVLDEMKNTPSNPSPQEARLFKALTGEDLEGNLLGEFEFNAGKHRTPTLLFTKEGEVTREYNPASYIGHMKSMDDATLESLPGSTPQQAENLFSSGGVDQVIQDLADFFSTGKFDPFGPSIRKPFTEANRTTHITEKQPSKPKPTIGEMNSIGKQVNDLFTEGAPIEGVDATLMKYDIDELHRGQNFSGGLYNWLGDVTAGESNAFMKYLKRMGFDPETTAFTELSGDLQKALVDSWRASRRRRP